MEAPVWTLLLFLCACDRTAESDPSDSGAPAVTDSGTVEDSDSGVAHDSAVDTSDTAAPEPSVCTLTSSKIECPHSTTSVRTGITGLASREVHYQVPNGAPPAEGWPTVFLFQGSLFTAELFWVALDTSAFGFWNQGLVTKTLLDSGYAVVTPEAHLQGGTFWDTNIPPWSLAWTSSPDHAFMLDLFELIDNGDLGDLDGQRLYATGISSGGYMTSRMNSAYPDRFRALAVQSASWQSCSGPLCSVPEQTADHLPTLFLHGEDDLIVPVSTMETYHQALSDAGADTRKVVQAGVGHAWIDAAPTEVVAWFNAHP